MRTLSLHNVSAEILLLLRHIIGGKKLNFRIF